ncbi:MAG: hypothetical protein QOI05_3015 [Bradyrhizobium sp.]|jgi:hypothetical protein|nr:hypothetical protein [Bradyrhizobium sp.]
MCALGEGAPHARHPIDRHEFLRGTAALGALPFAGPACAAAAEADPVARKIYFDNPDIGSVRISPDGLMLSWLKRGVPVTYITFPDEGHGPAASWCRDCRAD